MCDVIIGWWRIAESLAGGWLYVQNFRRLRRYIAENFHMSQQVAETKISAGPSRITRPAELNEIVVVQ